MGLILDGTTGISTTGNIVGNNIVINGAFIPTAVSASGNITGGNIIGNAIIGTLNPSAGPGFIPFGDLGSTGVLQYSSNVTTDSSNLSVAGNVYVNTNVSVVGNITGNYFIGNGSQLTGLPAGYSNAQVVAYGEAGWAGNIIPSANATYSLGNATNVWKELYVSNSSIVIGGVTLSNSGNTLQFGGANLVTASPTGVISTTGNIQGSNILTSGYVSATGNITTAGNVNIAGALSITGNINTFGSENVTGNLAAGNVTTIGYVSATGNITTAGNINAAGAFSVTGNINTGGSENVTGNLTAGNVNTFGAITAAGNVTAGNINTFGAISATGNLVASSISAFGGLAAGCVLITTSTISAFGNITGGNVNTSVVRGATSITVSTGGGNLNLSPTTGNIVVNNTYINGVLDPLQAQDVATKAYVDNFASTGISFHAPVFAATVANLATTTGGTITYTQPGGAGNGQGATITTTGSFNLVDTANIQTVGARVLVKDEGNAVLNGVYTWSNATAIVRSTDADEYGSDSSTQLSINDYFFVQSGSVNAGSAYIVNAPASTITFGTSNISFAQFSSSQTYTANTSAGISLVGTVFNTKVDGITTAFDIGGNITVKPSANLTTPNIGTATGVSLSMTGNITAANVSATNHSVSGYVSATGNIYGSNILTTGIISSTGNIIANSRIGIGNANPPYPLYVAITGTGTPVARFQGGTNTVDIYAGSGGTSYLGDANVNNAFGFNTSGNWVDIWTNNSEKIRIDSQGSMMLGGSFTSPPIGATLVVAGVANSTSTTTGALQVAGGAGIVGNINIGGNMVTAGSETVTGNVQAGNFRTAGLVSATGNIYAGNVITTGSESVTGTIQAGNVTTAGFISATGTITGAQFNGSGAGLTSIPGANVTGTVASATSATSATTAGTVTTAAQPSITSVGTLTSLTVSGALSSGAHTITGSPLTAIVNGGTSAVGNIGSAIAPFNTVYALATSAQYADLAEMYCADAEYAPGTVIEFGGEQEVTISSESHSTKVAGIVSTNPSYLMNSTMSCECATEVALVGRVPCRVVGTIRKGDRLVASNVPGVATLLDMSQYQPGCIIGKALEDYDSAEVGEIEVAVGRF